jgi:hypothetical protein
MSADLNALGNLWETTPEPTEQTRASARARLFAAIAADAKTVRGRAARVARRRSRRRLVLGLAAGVCVLAAGGTAIAAGLGAFSGHTTIADLRACDASTIALTTGSGAQVLTGHTDVGVSASRTRTPKEQWAGLQPNLAKPRWAKPLPAERWILPPIRM